MANEKVIWDYLRQTFNPYATAGIMGNLYAESALKPTNLQGSYEKKLGYTDDSYTKAVDNGTYTNFIKDQAGYGLAQWTYWSRKERLYYYAKNTGRSIGDLYMQLEFLVKELKENYNKTCYTPLLNAQSVLEASNIMLLKFERPANQGTTVQAKRASYGQKYYDMFMTVTTEPEVEEPVQIEDKLIYTRTLKKGMKGEDIKAMQNRLIALGYKCGKAGADGKFGNDTLSAVVLFQKAKGLKVDGLVGKKTIAALNG